MTFKLLFDQLKIKKWKEKYYTYEYCKSMLKEIKSFIDKLKRRQKKFEKSKSVLQKEYLRLIIDKLSNYLY